MKVHIERGEGTRRILFRLENINIGDENGEGGSAVLSFNHQYAAVYAAFLQCGFFDTARVVNYFFYKQYTKAPIEVRMVRYYYDIATGEVRNDAYLNRNIEKLLTYNFNISCKVINKEIKKQLEISDSQIMSRESGIALCADQKLLIKEKGKFNRWIGIDREEVCDDIEPTKEGLKRPIM